MSVMRAALNRTLIRVRLGGASFNGATALPSRSFSQKILIPTRLDTVAANMLEKKGYNVIQDPETPLADLIAEHSDASALIVRSEKITEEIISELPELQLVVRAGAGFNTIDIKAARQANVDVMNTPGANANAVAEEVITMILAAYRHVVPADISTRAGKWEKKHFMGRELAHKTVGIVGLGNIGQHIVKRLKGFECRVLGYDPLTSESKAKELGVTLCSVKEIFEQSDIVTLHVPENDETRGMVNRALLETMKDGAVLINAAREGIVSEADLRAFKQESEKKVMYCTDVYPKDEPGEKTIADVADLMLPHIGANTKEANFNAAKRAANQVADYFQKGIKQFVVNRSCPADLNPEFQKLAYYVSQVALLVLKGKTGGKPANQPLLLETTFYGELANFNKWLLPSAVLGMGYGKFDPSFGHNEAMSTLEAGGITYNDRKPDDTKQYGESLTVDLVCGQGDSYNKVSIRGTMTDGMPMIARINEFGGLYFNPLGHSLLVEYKDTVGIIAAITQVLARYNVNILDIKAPHSPITGRSLCLVQLDQKVDAETAKDIEILTRAERCAVIYLQ